MSKSKHNSITILPDGRDEIIKHLSDVIISLNTRIEFLNSYDLRYDEYIIAVRKLFFVFEIINFDKEHYLYSIKTLKKNLNND